MISVRTLKSARVSNTSFHSIRWASIVNSTISARKNSTVSGVFQRLQRDLFWRSAWAAACASARLMAVAPGPMDEGFQAWLVRRQPPGPCRKMPQEVKHQKTDGHVPDPPARGAVRGYGFAVVITQIFKALEQFGLNARSRINTLASRFIDRLNGS